MDWVILTDELLARVEMLAAEKRDAATSIAIKPRNIPKRPHETHHGVAAQLRNFASYFNRSS